MTISKTIQTRKYIKIPRARKYGSGKPFIGLKNANIMLKIEINEPK
jgi:hypothetical protein